LLRGSSVGWVILLQVVETRNTFQNDGPKNVVQPIIFDFGGLYVMIIETGGCHNKQKPCFGL
jgi:hypothetical protein